MTASEMELVEWLTEGQAALEANRPHDAAQAFARVRDVLPDDLSVALMLANAWRLAGRVTEERNALRGAFAIAAHAGADATTLHDLGTSLLSAGAPVEAAACFSQVVQQRSNDAAALGALAAATRAAGNPASAWRTMETALRLAPRNATLLLTAAQIRHALGDLEGARTWLDRADAERPDHRPIQMQRALTSLLGGLSAEGWAMFEHRSLPPAHGTSKAWHGEPLHGASICVIGEQGLGDQFHFARYIRRLETRGATRVRFSCAASAVSLFRASGFDACEPGDAPDTDWYVPLLSLPQRLGSGDDVAADVVPYLRADAPTDARKHDGPQRIGLVWKGNPAFGSTHLRDFDAALLPALARIPNVEWVWLQYGEQPPADLANVCVPSLEGDWLATARLLTTLDGMVSVDTSVAHLAGAMGLPVFVLLPHSPDWRWGLTGDRTAWYPSATLIRQTTPGDWPGVVSRLESLLAR